MPANQALGNSPVVYQYYPPDWVPEAGSLNKYHGKHALGDRARKLDKGILIVRFEMPFNIWCGGCNNHIGQGVRYNAEKSKVGEYYSTPILQFRCKCHLCQSWFEIRTDPKNTRYVVHSGARQKNEDFNEEENGHFIIDAKPDGDAPPDPLAALEKSIGQKKKALTAAAHLDELETLSSNRWSDPYSASVALRSVFRKEKKVRVESEGRAEKVREKYGLGDMVKKEDLRTPAPEMRMMEDAEWAEAQRERARREEISKGKRKREMGQLGWRDDDATESPHKRRHPSSVSGSKRVSTSSTSRRHSLLSGHRSSSVHSPRTIVKPPRSSSTPSISTTPSSAVKELATRLRLSSALKADPFLLGSSTPRKEKARVSLDNSAGAVQIKKRKLEGGT